MDIFLASMRAIIDAQDCEAPLTPAARIAYAMLGVLMQSYGFNVGFE